MTDAPGIIGTLAFLAFTFVCVVAGIVIARVQKVRDDIARGIHKHP